ncbi:CgeB family protein [Telluribacter humicola]|uniref:CgeB family protein n=1 Tax=Telluribacter humicola TaxID=1720261 RepID=UPI001E4CACBF|nr:glycosyltransferase [Telluribacter humicola]
MCNPYNAVSDQITSRWLGHLHHKTGYQLLQRRLSQWLIQITQTIDAPDMIWVDGGELFGPACLNQLKTFKCPIVLYNVDDPTGKRDGSRFKSLLQALPLYDMVVVVRSETEQECWKLGATKVLRVLRSYDEVAHHPFENRLAIPAQFRSEVAFIGTWMKHEKRDELLVTLVKQGIPVSIWGSRWQKSPYWHLLKDSYRGGALGGREYVAAIQGSKICLGMLSKGNRDLHTQRSLEVPFAGGLFCAERTTEHQQLYKEGVEAIFWSDADECALLCKQLLQDDTSREQIRQAGMRRVRELSVGNEDVCKTIVWAALNQHTYSNQKL